MTSMKKDNVQHKDIITEFEDVLKTQYRDVDLAILMYLEFKCTADINFLKRLKCLLQLKETYLKTKHKIQQEK